MEQARDDLGNLRWFVYLSSGQRKVTWAKSASAALAKSVNAVRVVPAPPLGAKSQPKEQV